MSRSSLRYEKIREIESLGVRSLLGGEMAQFEVRTGTRRKKWKNI